MKNLFLIIFLSTALIPVATFGQQSTKLDTLYLRCSRNDLDLIINHVNSDKRQVRTSFFFNKDWKIWGNKKTSIMIIYTSEPTTQKNWDWVIAQKKIDGIVKLENLMPLELFLEKLNKPDFTSSISKKKLIMLLVSENEQKYEQYPVTIGSDLYDPNDLNIPEHKPSKN
jgi:hypothetical protein